MYALDQSSRKISGYSIDGITGLLLPLPDVPSSGADSLNAISVDTLGRRVYAVGGTVVDGYTLFGNNGRLKLLSGSPFGPVGSASSLTMDLSESFMWITNSDNNNVSAFAITKATGTLSPLSGAPFTAGSGPSSITVLNAFQ